MNFMKNKDLGFDQENIILFFGISENLNKSYKAIQEEINSIPNVISISAAQSFPSAGLSGMNLSLEGSDPSTAFSVKENRIQDNYIKTLGMQIVQGRDFIPDAPADDEGYIINETAARMLGLPNPIDARVMMWRRPGKIIGVVKDYHLTSLRDDIAPLIISRYNPSINNITVKIEEFNKAETINQITSVLQKYDPNYNPHYRYLKDFLLAQYGSEERTFKLILSASILALILSMVGLYALSSYSIANRTKELGIRKILGASLSTLLNLLLTDSTKWVLVANIVALPVGWYFSRKWLNDFTYRIELTPWIFFTAILVTFTIAVLTIAWQIIRAARANPIETLRYE
jgi:putative ABC transport system permease protein